MSDTHSCTFPGCGKVFSKAFELKKHTATHEDPGSVFYCPECTFITLQKKNLAIHFAGHTGEKIHQCPHMIHFVDSPGSLAREERCEYRTNDPAALTKHRKKAHGYIPPANRSRPTKDVRAAPYKPRQRKGGKVSRPPPLSQSPLPVSCPKPSRVPEKVNSSSSDFGHASTSTVPPEDSSPFLWQGSTNVYEQSTESFFSDVFGCDFSVLSNATLPAPEEEMQINALYDPSLQPQWMAKYEMSYSIFDTTGSNYLPEPLPAVPPSDPVSLDAQTGREGCLCPEWMVEAGIEGWDQSALDTRRQFYRV